MTLEELHAYAKSRNRKDLFEITVTRQDGLGIEVRLRPQIYSVCVVRDDQLLGAAEEARAIVDGTLEAAIEFGVDKYAEVAQ